MTKTKAKTKAEIKAEAETKTLLPLNAKAIERAIEQVTIEQLGVDLTPVDINPLTCASKLLPIIAQAWLVSINGLSEQEQRTLIANALEIHKYKGTVYAVQKALEAVFNNPEIIEHNAAFEFDAKVTFKNDRNAVYHHNKFSTARALVNKAKNARSRFNTFNAGFPDARANIQKTDAASVKLSLASHLNFNATAKAAVYGAVQWKI